ncbi:MAG: glycoside hydrolase family 99-like domain-containing protein [Planctomycetes bacterium]|nr:glycoside hydrolase family 99-like domain-containing protein [Planctomycetota bacterium]
MWINRLLLVCLAAVLVACPPGCGKGNSEEGETKIITLGAYYFPMNPGKNNLRQKLVPEQLPLLGNYDCRAETTLKQHLLWANQAGINFFLMHWWGQSTTTDNTVKSFSDNLTKEKSAVKFCISYMTPYIHKTLNFETALDQTCEGQMVANFIYLAQAYFKHPNYFRINNKPVVFLYLSRLLKSDKGDYHKAFSRIRTLVKDKTEDELYLIGDEVFWNEPKQTRINELDAVTAYNMYGPVRYSGYAEESGILKDMDEVFASYKKSAQTLSKGFIPAVMPGFNDRGVPEAERLKFQETHYIIPRLVSVANQEEGSFYRAYFRLAKKHIDPNLNIILINSWNGWESDTQIEPVKSFVVGTKHPPELTGGYEYNPYGDTYLNITREEKILKIDKQE